MIKKQTLTEKNRTECPLKKQTYQHLLDKKLTANINSKNYINDG